MKEWKCVTKQKLVDFVKSYPFPLVENLYMDWYSWNDSRDGRKWPESVVAMASVYDDEFKIYDGYIQRAQGGKLMYDDLVKRLRNRRICVQQSGGLEDFPLLKEAASAIEELQKVIDGLEAENDALCKRIDELAKLCAYRPCPEPPKEGDA